jgi:aspartate-semialdehyde dehydrogenase
VRAELTLRERGARIAITGATGAAGHAVRTVLAAQKVPAEQVRLLEKGSEEAIISEYAGQATLIGTLEKESLSDRDVVFLCGSAEESIRCLGYDRKEGSAFIDLSGATVSHPEVPVVDLEINAAILRGKPRTVSAPQGISFALTGPLAPIDREMGVQSASAVIFRPASDLGEPGVEELHRQTVSLLNFTDFPDQVFGRQMAFNLFPQASLDASSKRAGLETQLAGEVNRVFEWTPPRVTIRVLLAPIFHSHSAIVHLLVRERSTVGDLRKLLAKARGVSLPAPARAPVSPVDVAGKDVELVVDVTVDGMGEHGFWAWIVGSDLPNRAAKNAVEIAARLLSG